MLSLCETCGRDTCRSFLNSDLTASDGEQFRYGKDADGNRGVIVRGDDGADTVLPFSGYPYMEVKYFSTSSITYTFAFEPKIIVTLAYFSGDISNRCDFYYKKNAQAIYKYCAWGHNLSNKNHISTAINGKTIKLSQANGTITGYLIVIG